jgi:hypothetical protein
MSHANLRSITFLHCRSSVVVLCFLAILTSIFMAPPCSTQEPGSRNDLSTQSSSRVVINSDLDFAQQGWHGNGSKANPYLIDGLTFFNLTAPCIVIGNVSGFVEISHCSFEQTQMSEEYGTWPRTTEVWLNNVKYVEISECSFSSGMWHINARKSDTLIVAGCTINGGSLGSTIDVTSYQIMDSTISANDALYASDTRNCLVYNNRIAAQDTSDYWFVTGADITNISANYISGNIDCLMASNNIIVENNTATGRFTLSLQIGGGHLLSVTGNVFGAGGLSATDVTSISPALQNAIISDNYIHQQPILFLKKQNQTSVDLTQVAQLIAYKCEGLAVSGSANNVSNAVILQDCKNSSLNHISITGCKVGIWMDSSTGINVSSFSISSGTTGVCIVNSENVSLKAGTVSAYVTGASIWATKGTIITSCRFTNDDSGIHMVVTSHSVIYNNTFDCRYTNVILISVDPNTDQWDYNGVGNKWNDYLGGGFYLIGFGEGRTMADHYPETLNPNAALFFIAEILIMGTLVAVSAGSGAYILLSKLRDRPLSSDSFNKHLFVFSGLLATFVPTFAVFGVSNLGTNFWCILSPFYVIWSDFGYLYMSSFMFLSNGGYLSSLTPGIPLPFLLLSEIVLYMAWKRAVAGRRYAALLILAFVLLILGSCGVFIPLNYQTTSQQWQLIPLPLGILAVYFLFKKPEPIEAPEAMSPKGVKLRCPECGAMYFYRAELITEGSVICQNCNKRIAIQDSPFNESQTTL